MKYLLTLLLLFLTGNNYAQNPAVIFGSGGYGKMLPNNGLEFKSGLKISDEISDLRLPQFIVTDTTSSSDLLTVGSSGVMSEVDVIINSAGYLQLPVGTTAQRPSTPNVGMFRFNYVQGLEYYTGLKWKQIKEPILKMPLILKSLDWDEYIPALTSVEEGMEVLHLIDPGTAISGDTVVPENFNFSDYDAYLNIPVICLTGNVKSTLVVSLRMRREGSASGGIDTIYHNISDTVVPDNPNTYKIVRIKLNDMSIEPLDLLTVRIRTDVASGWESLYHVVKTGAFISVEEK